MTAKCCTPSSWISAPFLGVNKSCVLKWIESKHWITHMDNIEYLSWSLSVFLLSSCCFRFGFKCCWCCWCAPMSEWVSHSFFLEHWTSTALWCLTPWSKCGLKTNQIMLRLSLFQTIVVNLTYVCCPWCKAMFWLNKTEFLSISPLCVAERRRRHEQTQSTSSSQSTQYSANGGPSDLCQPIRFKGQIVSTNEAAGVRLSRRQGAIFTSGSLGQSSAMAGAGAKRWYFSEEMFTKSPSRRQAVTADKEESYRQQAANFIQDMGQRLQV